MRIRFYSQYALLDRLSFELADVQVMIEAALVQQFLMRPSLDDLALVDDHDLIRIADRT